MVDTRTQAMINDDIRMAPNTPINKAEAYFDYDLQTLGKMILEKYEQEASNTGFDTRFKRAMYKMKIDMDRLLEDANEIGKLILEE